MSTDLFFTLACSAFIASLFGLILTFAGYKLFRSPIANLGIFLRSWLRRASYPGPFQ